MCLYPSSEAIFPLFTMLACLIASTSILVCIKVCVAGCVCVCISEHDTDSLGSTLRMCCVKPV